jgi:hypothetical protein
MCAGAFHNSYIFGITFGHCHPHQFHGPYLNRQQQFRILIRSRMHRFFHNIALIPWYHGTMESGTDEVLKWEDMPNLTVIEVWDASFRKLVMFIFLVEQWDAYY